MNFILSFAKKYENGFLQLVINENAVNQRNELKQKNALPIKSQNRIEQLNKIFKKLYEDNVFKKFWMSVI